MAIKKVKIIGHEGMQFGIVYIEGSEIAITVRAPGQEWPHGIQPSPGSINTIAEGCKAYIVSDE